MSSSTLTLEALFGDLNLDLELDPADAPPRAAPPPPAEPALPSRFAWDAEATLDLLGFTPASALLSDADLPARATRPYDVPADTFAQSLSLWGDDERFSALSTAPVLVDDIPEDAYPTRFTLIEPDLLDPL